MGSPSIFDASLLHCYLCAFLFICFPPIFVCGSAGVVCVLCYSPLLLLLLLISCRSCLAVHLCCLCLLSSLSVFIICLHTPLPFSCFIPLLVFFFFTLSWSSAFKCDSLRACAHLTWKKNFVSRLVSTRPVFVDSLFDVAVLCVSHVRVCARVCLCVVIGARD